MSSLETMTARTTPVPAQPLSLAAYRGDVAGLSALIAEGADPNQVDETGRTALMWAAREGHDAVVRALLKWGAAVDAPGPRNATALVEAVREGQAGAIRLLLEQGAQTAVYLEPEPSQERPEEDKAQLEQLISLHLEGLTPEERAEAEREQAEMDAWMRESETKVRKPRRVRLLSSAVRSGNPEALRALLESGLDPDDRFPEDSEEPEMISRMRPLKFAISFDDVEMVRLLLAFGADANGGIEDDSSALMGAVMQGNVEIARMLLEAGANPNQGMRSTPSLMLAVLNDNKELIALLIKHGAVATGRAGAEIEAVAAGLPDTRKTLAEQRGFGWHTAVLAGDVEGVRAALDAGADVNVAGDLDATALLLAAKRGTLTVVELLLDRGADLRARDRYGATALHYAGQTQADDGPQTVRVLAARGADPEATSQFGATPLIYAAFRDLQGIVAALKEVGASVGLADAALIGDAEAVRGFVAAGVPVDARNTAGMTALMGAAVRGDVPLLRFLLGAGADVAARKSDGEQALHYAVQRGHQEAAQVLLDAGADINALEGKNTPLTEAVTKGDVGMVRFLLARGASVEDDGPKRIEIDGLMHGTLWAEAEHRKRPEPEILPLLLEAGLDPNTLGAGDFLPLGQGGETALAYILRKELPEPYAQVLLSYGADPNVRRQGETLLLQMIDKGEADKVRRLLDWGADPNQGTTAVNPLDAALACEDEALVRLLRERGGSPSARLASDEFTPKTREDLLRSYTYQARAKAERAARQTGAVSPVGVIEVTEGPMPRVRMTRKWDALRAQNRAGSSDQKVLGTSEGGLPS